MDEREEEYKSKMEEVDRLIQEPETSKEIDAFLLKLSKKFKCDFRLMYEYYPESVEYDDILEHQVATFDRTAPTMSLGDFIGHISREHKDFKLYIDPIYLSKGLNEINDVLTTVVENDKVIVIPISHNKKYNLK